MSIVSLTDGNISHIAEEIARLSFEMGPIRPPSEGGSSSLLIRATRNCPWNRCTFCYGSSYQRQKFALRPVADIKADIDAAARIGSLIKKASRVLGVGGEVDGTVAAALVRSNRELNQHVSFIHVINWLASGGRTAFLQDADSLIMPTEDLVEVITYLKATLPSLERITSYARSHTVARKSGEELNALRAAGLSRLHFGLETGDDELLARIEKGVAAAQHIRAGRQAKAAGLEVSEYVMPDLGGPGMSEQHARNTARVLNEINPDFVRFRPFLPRLNTPMHEDYVNGKVTLSPPHARLRELKTLIENLEVTSRLVFDHFLNPAYRSNGLLVHLFTQDYQGYKMPGAKAELLGLIERGLAIDEGRWVTAEELIGAPSL